MLENVMNTAVIEPRTGRVINIIVCDPSQDRLPGMTLVEIPEGVVIDMRWTWSKESGFVPTDAYRQEIEKFDAEMKRIEAEREALPETKTLRAEYEKQLAVADDKPVK